MLNGSRVATRSGARRLASNAGLFAAMFVVSIAVGALSADVAAAATPNPDGAVSALPSPVRESGDLTISGNVPAADVGNTDCAGVVLTTTGTTAHSTLSIHTTTSRTGAFTARDIGIPDSFAIGAYALTASCIDASGAVAAPFATTTLQVVSVLPLDQKPHQPEQLLALLIVVVLVASILVVFWKKKKNVFSGADNRFSTSKTTALLWTPVVAYIIVTLGIIAVADSQFGLWHALVGSPVGVYLVLLGGPFASLVGAKSIVSTRRDNGTLQKPVSDGPKLSDLVSDDSGDLDVVDTQYLFFNVVAIIVVLAQFVRRPGFGAPDIPWFLAALTGTSAATYLTNKALGSNAPNVTRVVPERARVDQLVTAYGTNLAAAGADGEKPQITVGGHLADATSTNATDTAITFRVPAPASGVAYPANLEQQVVVTTVAGIVAIADHGLTIYAENIAPQRVDPAQVPNGNAFTVFGTNLFAAGDENADLTVSAGAASPVSIVDAAGAITACPRQAPPAATDSDSQVTVVVPAGTAAGAYGVTVRGTPLAAPQLNVT